MDIREAYPGDWARHLHPLYGPDSNVPAPGKQPKFPNWPDLPEILKDEKPEDIYAGIEETLADGDNVGLVIPEGVTVFDCDDPEYVQKLLTVYHDAPAQLTRSGGLHLFFRLKPGEAMSNAQKIFLHGAKGDIRTKGGQVVVYPSIGVGGGEYRWLRPLPEDMSKLPLRPDELTAALTKQGGGPKGEPRDYGPRPEVSDKPPSKKDVEMLENYSPDLVVRLISGRPVADPGDRDNALMRAIGAIFAYADSADPKVPFKLLSYSVHKDTSEGAPSVGNLWSKCKRLADKQWDERERMAALKESMMRKKRETAADAAGKEGTSVEELKRRLVIYLNGGSNYYVFNERTNRYYGPVGSNGLVERLETLSPSLITRSLLRSASGASRSDKDILSAYGTPVEAVEMRVGENGARFDAGGNRLIAGVWELRSGLEAEYNEDIANWLQLLGGDNPEKLLDWIATVADNKLPSCAIYLRGPKQCGKSLLAHGLARLWGQPFTPYRNAVTRFNGPILRSPLVVLDEGLSENQSSAAFREFVAANDITVERKYQAPITLVGSPRVLITSNNDDALRIRDEVGVDDLSAITDRIGWIEVDPKAGDFLQQLGGRLSGTAGWVDEDMIAKHALWLRENRKVTPGDRFIVPGWKHDKLEQLPGRMSGTAEVLTTIAYHLADRAGGKPAPGAYGIVPTEKIVYVNVPALVLYWESGGARLGQRPTASRVGRALNTVSFGRSLRRTSEGRLRFWEVDVSKVLVKAEEIGIGDIEKIKELLQSGEQDQDAGEA